VVAVRALKAALVVVRPILRDKRIHVGRPQLGHGGRSMKWGCWMCGLARAPRVTGGSATISQPPTPGAKPLPVMRLYGDRQTQCRVARVETKVVKTDQPDHRHPQIKTRSALENGLIFPDDRDRLASRPLSPLGARRLTTVTRTPRRCTASTSERKSPSPEKSTM
jgi:hypothetical protein